MPARHPHQIYPGFRSWKNDTPIQFTRRWLRYALVSLQIDPAIISFDAEDTAVEGAVSSCASGFAAASSGSSTAMHRSVYDDPRGFRAARRHVPCGRSRRARLSTLQLLWSKRRTRVSPPALAAVHRILKGSPGGVARLADVTDGIGRTSAEGLDVIAALAIRGVLTLDLTTRLGPSTPVRLSAVRMGPTTLESEIDGARTAKAVDVSDLEVSVADEPSLRDSLPSGATDGWPRESPVLTRAMAPKRQRAARPDSRHTHQNK